MIPTLLADTAGAYTWVYIVVGVITLVGGGGLLGLLKWVRTQGIRDDKLDLVIRVVLGEEDPDPKKRVPGLIERFERMNAAIEEVRTDLVNVRVELKAVTTPNGGKSFADRVTRTETSLAGLTTTVHEHIGESKQIHRDLRSDVTALQRTKT